MSRFKAFVMLRRGTSPDGTRRPALGPEDAASIRCCRCGGGRLKLSYRRHDRSADSDEPRTVFILRCADCEGFTTVRA